jgi:hypothetical protein
LLSYPSGMTVSSRALGVLSDALRAHRNQRRTRRRKLSPGRQALPVLAHLRKGETYADLACGFTIGTSTAYRYIREALDLLAAMAPTLTQVIEVASRNAFVILDGTPLRIDRVGMASGHDRAFYSGKHKAHGLNVPVIADPIGRLVWISPPLPGARHDMGAARRSAMAQAPPLPHRSDEQCGQDEGDRGKCGSERETASHGTGTERLPRALSVSLLFGLVTDRFALDRMDPAQGSAGAGGRIELNPRTGRDGVVTCGSVGTAPSGRLCGWGAVPGRAAVSTGPVRNDHEHSAPPWTRSGSMRRGPASVRRKSAMTGRS